MATETFTAEDYRAIARSYQVGLSRYGPDWEAETVLSALAIAARVTDALAEHDAALERREHGGVAAHKLVDAVRAALTGGSNHGN